MGKVIIKPEQQKTERAQTSQDQLPVDRPTINSPCFSFSLIFAAFTLVLIAQQNLGFWVELHKPFLMLLISFYFSAWSLKVDENLSWKNRLCRISTPVILFILLRTSHQNGKDLLAINAVILWLVSIRFSTESRQRLKILNTLLLFCCVSAIYNAVVYYPLGHAWNIQNHMIRQFVILITPSLQFQSTASQIQIWISAVMLAIAGLISFNSQHKLKLAIQYFCVLAALFVGFLFLCKWIQPQYWSLHMGESERGNMAQDVTFIQPYWQSFLSMYDFGIVLLLCNTMLLLWLFRSLVVTSHDTLSTVPSRRYAFSLTIGLLFIVCGYQVAFSSVVDSASVNNDLSNLNIGVFNTWDEKVPTRKPQHGYGIANTGMYGVFLNDLRARGANVIPLQELQVDQRVLGTQQSNSTNPKAKLITSSIPKCDVIIFMVRTNSFLEDELKAIDQYLNEGKTILCVGDHTNLAECQEPFNQLTSKYGITLQFDSAFSHLKWWFGNIDVSPDLNYSPQCWLEYGMGTGASLGLERQAVPLLVSKYSFGDHGNIFKSDPKDAYLGDYTYQHGELLGDMVLAAKSQAGKGAVLGFGDSSMFQNIAYTRSGRFIRHLLVHYGKRVYNSVSSLPIVISFVILQTSLLMLLFGKAKKSRLSVALVLMISAFGFLTLTGRSVVATVSNPVELNAAAILDSPKSMINRIPFNQFSYSALPINLLRNQYVPEWIYDLDGLLGQNYQFLFTPGLAETFSKEQESILDQYMKSGGVLVMTLGQSLELPSRDFLEKHKLKVSTNPLGGDINQNPDGKTPTFINAWEIIQLDQSSKVLFQRLGCPAVVFSPVGKGGLLVIGDSHFLCDKNLEMEKKGIAANIHLFELLLSRIRSRNFAEITLDDLGQKPLLDQNSPLFDKPIHNVLPKLTPGE